MINLTKRGKVYHANTTIGGVRLRGSLGTVNEKAAKQLASRMEVALSSGNKDVWAGLKLVLPEATYLTFSEGKVAEPITVKDVFEGYLRRIDRKRVGQEIAVSTEERYRGATYEFAVWLKERNVRLMDEITPTMIEEYRAYRLAQTLQRKQSRGGQGLDVDVVVLKQIFDLAMELGYSKPNPVKSISRTKVKPSKVPEPFTSEEMALMRIHITTGKGLLAFHLLQYTGMRGSDVVGLTWGQVDFDSKTIVRNTQKRGTEVRIPIHEYLLSTLYPWRASQNEALVLEGMTRPQLYTLVQKLGEKAGVSNCRPHRFRSTLATELLAKGTSIHDVALLLGDTVAVVEKHYSGHKEASVERIRGIMDSGGENDTSNLPISAY